MRRETIGELKRKLLLGVFTLVLIATFGLVWVFVSHAESQAKVTARSANIRKEANANSDKVGGVKQDEVVTVISTVKGADGKDWYQVSYNNMTGYIRADLVKITDGTTPPAGGEGGGENNNPPADIRPMDPVSATVSRDSGRVRDHASVSAGIVSEVPNGLVLTVTGEVTDGDGSVWYQVNYNSGEEQVNGFIRSDYVTLSDASNPPEADTPPEDTTQDPAAQDKPYDTILWEGEWHLYETATNNAYKITDLFASAETANANAALYEEVAKSEKNQKIIIIVLVFLLVAAVAGIAFLVFKIRDMMDAAYFSEVENDALRKRKAASQGGGQRVMHTVGSEGQQGRSGGGRSSGGVQGQRVQGSGQGMSQGQRMQGSGQRQSGTQGQRMQGSGQRQPGMSQGQRMQGSGQGMSQGQRMQGSGQGMNVGPSQGQRMQGSGQGMGGGYPQRSQGSNQGMGAGMPQGQRIQGQRMSGMDERMQEPDERAMQDQRIRGQRMSDLSQDERVMQGQRTGMPQGQRGQRPSAPQGARPVQSAQDRGQRRNEEQGWQSRNFMAEEEEEFDLEFLNYDEEQ